MLKYFYIDESGDLGKYGSKYFTVIALIVDDPLKLKRIIKKIRSKKIKKKIKELPELKANSSNKGVRELVLKEVKKSPCSIIAIVVNKNLIMDHLFKVKEKLYNYICGILMGKIPLDKGKTIIIIDKKHTNTLLREDFNDYIKRKMSNFNKNLKIEINHLSSQSSNELQVADFVAWSINRKFNSGEDHYYNIIKDKIINKEEMLLCVQ